MPLEPIASTLFDPRDYGAYHDGIRDDSAAWLRLAGWLTDPNGPTKGAGGTFILAGTPRISATMALPASVNLFCLPGMRATADSGKTVTVNGLTTGAEQATTMFSGAGTWTFGKTPAIAGGTVNVPISAATPQATAAAGAAGGTGQVSDAGHVHPYGPGVVTLTDAQSLTNKTFDNTSNIPVRVASTTLGAPASSITLAIPAGYKHLQVEAALRSDGASVSQAISIRFNADAGNNYSSLTAQFNGTGVTVADSYNQPSGALGTIPAANGQANAFGPVHIDIPGYNVSGAIKSYQSQADSITGLSAGDIFKQECSGWWTINTLAAISSITLLAGTTNFVANSTVTVYAIP